MHTYIALLRGINVSGQKKILMADLKKLFEEMGFRDIKTYIQSGNVIFESKEKHSETALAAQIARAVKNKYGFEVPVLVKDLAAWKQAIVQNPFLKEKNINPEKLHITFLAEQPAAENIEKIKKTPFPPDRFEWKGKEIYLHCPDRYGETKFSNKFFENKLKVQATTRNWKTVNKLLEMAEA